MDPKVIPEPRGMADCTWRASFPGDLPGRIFSHPRTGDVIGSTLDRHEERLSNAPNTIRIRLSPCEAFAVGPNGRVLWRRPKAEVVGMGPQGEIAVRESVGLVLLDPCGAHLRRFECGPEWSLAGWDEVGAPIVMDERIARETMKGDCAQVLFICGTGYSWRDDRLCIWDRLGRMVREYALPFVERMQREWQKLRGHGRVIGNGPPPGSWRLTFDGKRDRLLATHCATPSLIAAGSLDGQVVWVTDTETGCCNFACCILGSERLLHGSSCGQCLTVLSPEGEVLCAHSPGGPLLALEPGKNGGAWSVAMRMDKSTESRLRLIAVDASGESAVQAALPFADCDSIHALAIDESMAYFAVRDRRGQVQVAAVRTDAGLFGSVRP